MRSAGVSEGRALTAFHFEFSAVSKMAACCAALKTAKKRHTQWDKKGHCLAISTSLDVVCVLALSHNLGPWALASFLVIFLLGFVLRLYLVPPSIMMLMMGSLMCCILFGSPLQTVNLLLKGSLYSCPGAPCTFTSMFCKMCVENTHV